MVAKLLVVVPFVEAAGDADNAVQRVEDAGHDDNIVGVEIEGDTEDILQKGKGGRIRRNSLNEHA